MSFPFVEPVTLLINGASTSNEFGDPVPSQTPIDVLGAFNPGVSAEQAAQGIGSTQPEVYLPPETQVPSWIDAVKVRGVTYQVAGQPADWRSGQDGSSFGIVVRLRGVLAEPR